MKAEGLLVLAGGAFLGVIAIRGTWRQMFPFLVSPPSPPMATTDITAASQHPGQPSEVPRQSNGKCPPCYSISAVTGKCVFDRNASC